MQFTNEGQKSGWLTKLGGNSLRKTWKRRWFDLRGSYLYYYRQQVCVISGGLVKFTSVPKILKLFNFSERHRTFRSDKSFII